MLDLRTYTTFTQYWTGEPIERFPSLGLGNLQKLFPVLHGLENLKYFPSNRLGNLELFPVLVWGTKNLFPVLDWETYRTFSQYCTGEPIEPFPSSGQGNLEPFSSVGLENIYNLYPVLDRGTYRTFSQSWTWELIEPFPSTAWTGKSKIFSQ